LENIRSLCRARLVCSKWKDIITEKPLAQEKILLAKRSLRIGWLGSICREDAEARVNGSPSGTFLFRYSTRVKSYVCTLKGKNSVEHIADIRPDKEKGGIIVFKKNGTTSHLQSLYKYVEFMKVKGIVDEPVPLKDEELTRLFIKNNPQVPSTILQDLGANHPDLPPIVKKEVKFFQPHEESTHLSPSFLGLEAKLLTGLEEQRTEKRPTLTRKSSFFGNWFHKSQKKVEDPKKIS